MKITYRIPTEQYAYVEITEDNSLLMSPELIRQDYEQYADAFKIKPINSLPTKDFNAALDRYLTEETGETEVYVSMSPDQQRVFQEIKKSLNRIKSRESKPVIEN